MTKPSMRCVRMWGLNRLSGLPGRLVGARGGWPRPPTTSGRMGGGRGDGGGGGSLLLVLCEGSSTSDDWITE